MAEKIPISNHKTRIKKNKILMLQRELNATGSYTKLFFKGAGKMLY
jgi:hypothetical protein